MGKSVVAIFNEKYYISLGDYCRHINMPWTIM